MLKKRVGTLRYNNASLLKEFRGFIIGDSRGLQLEAEHLDDL